jgi:AcrR family transcriptional regulator
MARRSKSQSEKPPAATVLRAAGGARGAEAWAPSAVTAAGPRGRILDAAERVFAESGFEGGSLRSIVREAGVNLAAVNYYFQSKERLMAAVLQRRFGPLREEQLASLRRFEQGGRGRPLPVEKILEALLVPALRLAEQAAASPQPVMRLVGRLASEPNPQAQALLRHGRRRVQAAVLDALGRALPGHPLAELYWRVEFLWGALAFILCNPGKLEQESKGLCRPADPRAVLAQMIPFFAAGFQAATPNPSPRLLF